MPEMAPTNAASSGVTLDRKTLKAIARRSDGPGLVYLACWGAGLLATGSFVWLSLGTWWMWPAMFVHGVVLSVPAYAISHETAHGTAFRSHWLNETVLWIGSLIYMEEPLHRRYTHTNHHTFTWHVGKDSQMPFDTPMTLARWLAEISGFALMRFQATVMLRLVSGRYCDVMRMVAPDDELRKMSRNAWVFLAVGKDSQMPFDTPMTLARWLAEISGFALMRFQATVMLRLVSGRYCDVMRMVAPDDELRKMSRNAWVFLAVCAAIGVAIALGVHWPAWFLVLPRLLGAPIMLLFTLIQHVEMAENAPSIVQSTRSFRTGRLGRFLYMNMNNHVEHHLFPQVPFFALPALREAIASQVPAPDPGFVRTNWEVLTVVVRRTLGLSTKAPTIRQAPHMVSAGGVRRRIAYRTM